MGGIKKILLVEDEPDIQRITSFRLKKAGFEVVIAGDGKLALELAKTEKPDLILLDLGLPIIPGREVCATLKNDIELKKIPVIILTASTDAIGDENKMKELGADDYLSKPFEPDILIGTIKKFLSD